MIIGFFAVIGFGLVVVTAHSDGAVVIMIIAGQFATRAKVLFIATWAI